MATSAAATGAWTVQSTNNALAGRAHDNIALLTGATTDPTTARSGVFASSSTSGGVWQDLLVTASTATGTLQCLINAGGGVINRTGQGPYQWWSSAQKTVTLTTANGSNPRIDRISARIYDLAQGDTVPGTLPSNGGVQLEVTDGTPAASPSAPSLPPNAIPLATVLVPTSAVNSSSLTVTDVRQSAGEFGSVRPVLPGDAFTGINSTSPAGFAVGELLDDGTNAIHRWTGTKYRPIATYSAFTYTPTWTMANSAGTKSGRYFLQGNMCWVTAVHVANASTGLGLGNISVTLPFLSANVSGYVWTGDCHVDSGTGLAYMGRVAVGFNDNQASIWFWQASNIDAGQVDTPGNAGVVYGNGGTFRVNICYEIAP